jgi:serine O-acetyltransferase
MFEALMYMNCHSKMKSMRWLARELLEKLYNCEVHCEHMDASVRFAHHARGCTIVAAKIYENVVIYQNVTIGTNLRFNKSSNEWENVGSPIISSNVLIGDGAKILGPIVIGENSVVAAGAIITKDVPPGSVAYGTNQFRPRDSTHDLMFRIPMIRPTEIIAANQRRIEKFESMLSRE